MTEVVRAYSITIIQMLFTYRMVMVKGIPAVGSSVWELPPVRAPDWARTV